jgi:hypothetical protein
LHFCEQQSLSAAHEFPSVLQLALSAWQVPPLQMPPQHWLSCEHEPPSDTHCLSEHTLSMQLTEQQSVFAEHELPAGPHVVGFAEHAPCGSQTPEQHVSPLVHAVPKTPHGWLASAVPFFPPPQAAATNNASSARRSFI